MSKTKSIFVTALCALMLAAILVGLYMLNLRAYMVLAGLLALYGFLCGAFHFCHWLGKETPLLPPAHKQEPPTLSVAQTKEAAFEPETFSATYDEIKAEVEAEDGQKDS